jgi:hypothetical protein
VDNSLGTIVVALPLTTFGSGVVLGMIVEALPLTIRIDENSCKMKMIKLDYYRLQLE